MDACISNRVPQTPPEPPPPHGIKKKDETLKNLLKDDDKNNNSKTPITGMKERKITNEGTSMTCADIACRIRSVAQGLGSKDNITVMVLKI
jgi:hypothetical protein